MISPTLKSTAAAAMLASLVAVPAAANADSNAASPTDQVFVLQGVPKAAVDIAVDGKMVKSNLAAKGIVGPLMMTPGKHIITFSSDRWTVKSMLKVTHESSDVILHWPADLTKKPEVTVYANNLAPVGVGHGRLTVAHTAVVPPADILVDNKVVFSNIANGEFLTKDVPGGTYSVAVVPAGETDPLLGPVDLAVKSGLLTRVFAIGQPTNGSMDAIVQTLRLTSTGSATPGSVDAGSAGLVATPAATADAGTSMTMPLLAGATMGVGVFALLAWRRRMAR